MREPTKTVLTAQSDLRKISVELTWDCDMDEVVSAFHTVAVGLSFSHETFVDGLIAWLENNVPRQTFAHLAPTSGDPYEE